jgi:hypothetical protein
MFPVLLLLAGCPSGGGGEGGFGVGGTGVAYVVNTGPNEISAYTTDVVGALRDAGTVALADVPSSISVSSDSVFAFAGTNDGVYAFRVNSGTGELSSVSGSPFSTGNSFTALTLSPNNRVGVFDQCDDRLVDLYRHRECRDIAKRSRRVAERPISLCEQSRL